jgi:hypothetical protein
MDILSWFFWGEVLDVDFFRYFILFSFFDLALALALAM